MTTDRIESMIGPQVNIFLVAHTNVGKTTLVRTLLGKDVGEVEDSPDVTQAMAAYDLVVDPNAGALRLWDTPGFGDSFRLAQRLRQKHRWIAWTVREVWDRFFNKRLWRFQRLAFDLRARASVILYLVNLQERPVDAVYVAPEFAVLDWIGKPVLVILNQGGDPNGPGRDQTRENEWRAHASAFPVVHSVVNLDAYTRCWLQELTLFTEIGKVLPDKERTDYTRLAVLLGKSYADRFDESVAAIADHLLHLAGDKVELEVGWFEGIKDVWGSVRKSIPWGSSIDMTPFGQAFQSLAQRYAESTKTVTDRLITINRLDGASAAEIVKAASAKLTTAKPLDAGSAGVFAGVISGVLSGLGADLLAGGLTLGTGALVGGVLGATAATALAKGYNVYNGKDKKVVGWSPDSLTEAFGKSLMLYLAVAHFGRGQGEWHRKEEPQQWSAQLNLALNRYQVPLRCLWPGVAQNPMGAQARSQCEALVREAIIDVLMNLYPQSQVLVQRKPGEAPGLSDPTQPATKSPMTGSGAYSSSGLPNFLPK